MHKSLKMVLLKTIKGDEGSDFSSRRRCGKNKKQDVVFYAGGLVSLFSLKG